MDEKRLVDGTTALAEKQPRVIKIEPTERPQNVRLRVAAYTRVSSDSEDQLNSFAAQNRYYTELISSNPVLFSDMVLNETLYEHCAEIEETAKKRMEIIVPQLAKAYGVTEQLKAENQIEWVRQMNACVAQAEEAIKGELIYC